MHVPAFPSPRTSLLLIAGLVALVAVACGGGDESPEETATPDAVEATPTEAPTEPPTPAPTQPPAAEGGSVDEAYVRAICVAGNDLQTAMFSALVRMETEGVDPEDDPEAFGELFVEPLAGFLDDIRDVTPPDDIAEYHEAALAAYEGLIALFASVEEGEELEGGPLDLLGGMLGDAEAIPAIPEATRARLATVAADIPDCAGSIILDEFLGAGGGEPIDGGSGEPGASRPPDPEAEAYVRELCLAGDAYVATIEEANAGRGPDAELDESDPEVFATLFGEAMRGLSLAMLEMTPPAEIVQYHDAAGARFHEMANLLEGIIETLDAGGEVTDEQLARFQGLLAGGMGLPGLPFEYADRLAQAANNVVECLGSGFLYGLLGGGQ